MSAQSAIQLATQTKCNGTLYVLISLRLTFGGANRPAKWSTISKPFTDLRNALLLDNTWEAQETQTPNQDLIPPPSTKDISISFAESKALAVKIPVDPQAKIDIYLDDCIKVIPDIGNNRYRGNTAMPLVIHAVSRPLGQKYPPSRDKMIETSKEKSEGAL